MNSIPGARPILQANVFSTSGLDSSANLKPNHESKGLTGTLPLPTHLPMPVGTKDMITKGVVVLHVVPCPCPAVTTGMVTGE